jgi:hypothetical protein
MKRFAGAVVVVDADLPYRRIEVTLTPQEKDFFVFFDLASCVQPPLL